MYSRACSRVSCLVRAATVQRQLTRRLGPLSKEDDQRVRSLSIPLLGIDWPTTCWTSAIPLT